MPIRLLETPFGFVFEEFVNRREYDARALCADAHVKIDFIVQKMNVAVRYGRDPVVTRIVLRERNIGVSAQRTRKNVAAKIGNLQPVRGEEQWGRDAVEGQRFAEKDVVHSSCAIYLDVQTRVFAAAKLVNAIGSDIGRSPKFVWRDSLRNLWVDPKNCLGWIQRAPDV